MYSLRIDKKLINKTKKESNLKFLPELNEKLKQESKKKGCDAVIWVDYDFDREKDVQVITAYGTGVKLK